MAEVADPLASPARDHPSTTNTTNVSTIPVHEPLRKFEEHDFDPGDRDSGVFLFDTPDDLPPTFSPPTSRPTSVSLSHTPSRTSSPSLSRTDSNATARRLRRPAELNLSSPAAAPKTELEKRYDLIRNSQTQSKAALKSPTQLLKDRLNLTPKTEKHDVVRIFTPPQPMLNGCILPGPAAQLAAFTGSNVRAHTESTGRPAWWCKFDKLVVFDGIEPTATTSLEDGEDRAHGGMKFRTRSSKGLSIARRKGDTEAIIIPLDCEHCKEMLNRSEWKYDIQVCKRGVCWDCRERCRWEVENPLPSPVLDQSEGTPESTELEEKKISTQTAERSDTNRERADSVLQNEQLREEELMAKVGIEQGPQSPTEVMSGIEEVLETS
ncbi:hypothetical protein K504DRAFT_465144 [Pleomassaria siparia CBS 279.74]|uniref:Uncharacterized protein n=1 Tax=Pleomassaria siparia CBS 279.74 TaxID=1314801 RepID=A0A6G1KF26_9PLEO|nr:hypothetical protein K504DRAFT_465144 [Pleomassaria siparia CBS 279.74]